MRINAYITRTNDRVIRNREILRHAKRVNYRLLGNTVYYSYTAAPVSINGSIAQLSDTFTDSPSTFAAETSGEVVGERERHTVYIYLRKTQKKSTTVKVHTRLCQFASTFRAIIADCELHNVHVETNGARFTLIMRNVRSIDIDIDECLKLGTRNVFPEKIDCRFVY